MLTQNSSISSVPLLSEDEKISEEKEVELSADVLRPPKSHRRPWHRCTNSFHSLSIITLFSAVIVLSIVIIKDRHSSHHILRPLETSATNDLLSEPLDCGSTSTEARQKGCVFDLMLSQWIHELCYDAEMSDGYLLSGHHQYYLYGNWTGELSEAEVRRGEYTEIWVSNQFHFRHCMYTMDLQARAYLTGRPIEVGIYRYDHAQHCVNLTLLNDWGNTTVLYKRFGICGFPKH